MVGILYAEYSSGGVVATGKEVEEIIPESMLSFMSNAYGEEEEEVVMIH